MNQALAQSLLEAGETSLEGTTRLSDWGLIRAEGADAATFLQGQLTQDVLSLKLDQARLAGFCSPKGRLLASFIIWKTAPDSFLLACSADLLAPTLKRLSMFVLRAKCKLSDASQELGLWGLVGSSAASWLGVTAQEWSAAPALGGWAVRLGDVAGQPRWLWAGSTAHAQAADQWPVLPATAWQALEVASAVVRIQATTVEAFVPQMVNFELVNGVNFRKGCYPGQEVVARSQYRGTVKRRGALLAGPSGMKPGQEVFQAADPAQPAGLVAMAADISGEQGLAFVELKLAALELGDLHLGSAEGPLLTPQALPYALPAADRTGH